jgi:hypothetical protein
MQPNALDEDVLPRTYCEAAQDLPASTAADRALVALVRLLARSRLMQPDLVAEFAEAYQQEVNRQRAGADAARE